VRQPWASLIASGAKTLEVRSWRTSYRGPLLICAGARPSGTPDARRWPVTGPLGCAVACVELVECRPGVPGEDDEAACCPVAAGGYVWVLTSPREVAPRPISGRLGLWALPGLFASALKPARDPLVPRRTEN